MDILCVDLNNNNLNDANFDEDDPDTTTHVALLSWRNKFEKRKALKNEIMVRLVCARI